VPTVLATPSLAGAAVPAVVAVARRQAERKMRARLASEQREEHLRTEARNVWNKLYIQPAPEQVLDLDLPAAPVGKCYVMESATQRVALVQSAEDYQCEDVMDNFDSMTRCSEDTRDTAAAAFAFENEGACAVPPFFRGDVRA
jgi:hypothetical protein